jgi:hypothetical protein
MVYSQLMLVKPIFSSLPISNTLISPLKVQFSISSCHDGVKAPVIIPLCSDAADAKPSLLDFLINITLLAVELHGGYEHRH